MLIRNHIVTIDVFYYLPDHPSLINEFFWQTEDFVPEMPRVHHFLNYWKDNIDAIIKEVMVSYSRQTDWRRIL